MKTIYRPGQWHLIVIPGALIALPADVPGEMISDLWERLPSSKTLATVVDVLTSRSDGSFTALPPFAAAVVEGSDLRIALRGRVVARVTAGEGEVEFSGAEVTTWSERFVAGATKAEITVEEAESASVLPVQSGLVLAAAVSAEFEPADKEDLDGAPGPSPVVVAASLGASAAALTQDPAPLLAAFPVPGSAGTRPGGDEPALAGAGEEAAGASAPEDAEASSAPAASEEPSVIAPPAPAPASDADAEASPEPEAPAPAESPVPEASLEAEAPSETGDAPSEPEASSEPVDAPRSPDEADEPAVSDATLLPTEVTLAPTAEDDFDQLWGATVHSAPSTPGAAAAPAALAGDHDGSTISAAELRARRSPAPATADETPTAVLPVASADASAGRIRMSTGQVVALDRTVIIGRRPRSTRASGANLPHLVAVDSPQQDISRSHLEVRPEGDTVVVIDLHTTNGSTLLRPGADPVRLHPGEQTIVLSGDVVDLGDGVTVAFEDLP